MGKRKAECTPEEWAQELETRRLARARRVEEGREKSLKTNRTPEAWEKELERGRAKHKARRSDPVKRAEERRKNKEWKATPHGQAWQKRYMRKIYWRKAGFTPELVEQLLQAQGHKCAVCGVGITIATLHADHCHVSGKPRGLLCRPCNTAEGFVRATGIPAEEWGRKLAAYLAAPPARGTV